MICVKHYVLRDMWVSLYDFPPLVTFEGRLAFRKWFDFLELKIKNGWQFHFWNSNFSGQGKKGQYLKGCYFLWYVYKVLRCLSCVGVGWLVGWLVG